MRFSQSTQSPSSSLCMAFYSISSTIDEVLSINPSANVFVFGDFNVHHKDWLTYSSGTDRLVNSYNFSISDDLAQTVNFPTWIPDCHSHSPVLLDFLFLTLVFVLQGFPYIGKFWSCCCLSFHWFSIRFTMGCPFYRIAYEYSCADWDGLRDYLRDVP